MSVHHTEKEGLSQSISSLKTKRIRALSTQMVAEDADSGRYLIYKERGETLAVLVRRFRTEQGLGQEIPITYAGRLDPMAEGIVLLLVGEARHHKDQYLKLGKTYEIEVLLGISTDTQDMLGLIERELYRPITRVAITDTLKALASITELPYPPYSSVLVQGKPLFTYARAGTKVQVPVKTVQITEATLLHTRTVAVEAIARDVLTDIGRVEGDFRQLIIMKQWQKCTQTHKEHIATIATIRITASSGTYMRSIAAWMGEQLGVPALAYKIKRTKLGEYTL